MVVLVPKSRVGRTSFKATGTLPLFTATELVVPVSETEQTAGATEDRTSGVAVGEPIDNLQDFKNTMLMLYRSREKYSTYQQHGPDDQAIR
jgi:hypothetical protein